MHLSRVISAVATLRSAFLVLLDLQQRNYGKPLVGVDVSQQAFRELRLLLIRLLKSMLFGLLIAIVVV